jgi:hypothetical protein
MRLQWALLWLAATARGEAWTPPEPGAEALGAGDAAAAEEMVGGEIEVPISQAAPTQAPSEPEGPDGMVEI